MLLTAYGRCFDLAVGVEIESIRGAEMARLRGPRSIIFRMQQTLIVHTVDGTHRSRK